MVLLLVIVLRSRPETTLRNDIIYNQRIIIRTE